MEKAGFQGPEAAQIAAHSTRDRKQTFTAAEVLAAHKEMAEEFGNQPQQIIAAAKERALSQAQPGLHTDARGSVAFAKEKVFEREAVADERLIMREALRRGMGEVSFTETRDRVPATARRRGVPRPCRARSIVPAAASQHRRRLPPRGRTCSMFLPGRVR